MVSQCIKCLERWFSYQQIIYDLYYNIRTVPAITRLSIARFYNGPFGTAAESPNRIPYEPAQYSNIRRCIATITLVPSDQVFDIGCGAGRAVCLFARQNVTRCVGIEYVPWVAEAARTNARSLRGRRSVVDIRNEDARLSDYGGGTYYWLFNPFDLDVMREVPAYTALLGSGPPKNKNYLP